jgi:hypothetical protein
MKFLSRLFVLVAAVAALGYGIAAAQGGTDPLLGNRIAEGVFFDGQLWLRGALGDPQPSGALVSVNLATGVRTVHFERGVIDVDTFDGNLWVVREATEAARNFTIFQWKDGAFQPATNMGAGVPHPIAMIADDRKLVVLTPVTVHTFDKSLRRWLGIKLRAPLRYGVTLSVAMPTNEDVLYFGANNGESGGVLQRIDLGSGAVAEIQKQRSGNPCDGPLASACTPVTGIVADPGNGHCVIVSVGLAHGEVTDGRVLRVCGTDVTVVFEKKAAVQPAGSPIVMTEPIFGVFPAPGGFWAVGSTTVYRFKGDAHTDFPLPSTEPVAGTPIGRGVAGAIVVPTGVASATSVSGFTTLVVANEPPAQ